MNGDRGPHHLVDLIEPSPNVFPIPAMCYDGNLCEHRGQCPRIWIRQDFLLRPKVYSDYWSLHIDSRTGAFIVKSSHQYGNNKENYRTFVWKVSNKDSWTRESDGETFWLAVWVD